MKHIVDKVISITKNKSDGPKYHYLGNARIMKGRSLRARAIWKMYHGLITNPAICPNEDMKTDLIITKHLLIRNELAYFFKLRELQK